MASEDLRMSHSVVCTPYVSGVSLDMPSFGRVFAGYFAPVHKEPLSLPEIRQVIDTHDIILGDFNASRFHLNRAGMLLHPNVQVFNPPSYLPHIETPQSQMYVPAFDAIYSKGAAIQRRQGTGLPTLVHRTNPRSLMKTRGMCSDHTPVAAEVVFTNKGVRFVTWNVADPHFWARWYPQAAEGFPLTSEAARQLKIIDHVLGYISLCDVIVLQEVPAALVAKLESIAGDGFVCYKTPMHCTFGEFEDCSQVIVLVAKHLVI